MAANNPFNKNSNQNSNEKYAVLRQRIEQLHQELENMVQLRKNAILQARQEMTPKIVSLHTSNAITLLNLEDEIKEYNESIVALERLQQEAAIVECPLEGEKIRNKKLKEAKKEMEAHKLAISAASKKSTAAALKPSFMSGIKTRSKRNPTIQPAATPGISSPVATTYAPIASVGALRKKKKKRIKQKKAPALTSKALAANSFTVSRSNAAAANATEGEIFKGAREFSMNLQKMYVSNNDLINGVLFKSEKPLPKEYIENLAQYLSICFKVGQNGLAPPMDIKFEVEFFETANLVMIQEKKRAIARKEALLQEFNITNPKVEFRELINYIQDWKIVSDGELLPNVKTLEGRKKIVREYLSCLKAKLFADKAQIKLHSDSPPSAASFSASATPPTNPASTATPLTAATSPSTSYNMADFAGNIGEWTYKKSADLVDLKQMGDVVNSFTAVSITSKSKKMRTKKRR